VLQPPLLGLEDDQTVVLTIPRFRLSYHAHVAGLKDEHGLLDFESQFRLRAKIVFTDDAQFKVEFDEKPITDFKVLERTRVGESVQDEHLYNTLNTEVSRVLSGVAIDIPLLRGRKLDLQHLGIDGNEKHGKFLSVYLKVSNHASGGHLGNAPLK
jgi:hypothetical protein